ncbi:MAG TPA: tetratricopeptide repeat protein [Thiotrichaceae bacterium]|nr:tetratricopeptide repeat protein [Thiotrichaceae bacterium]
MLQELNIYFPDPQHLAISLTDNHNSEKTQLLEFSSPISDKGHQHLHWYLKEYPNQYSAEVDIDAAQQIAKQFPPLGHSLFNKVFAKKAAQRLYKKFIAHKQPGRILTITSLEPSILSLPWELLHPSGKGSGFLIFETPPISIRRRAPSISKKSFEINQKDKIHLLVVISRPTDTLPRDPQVPASAVLNAIEQYGAERITIEFLRPATLKQLRERLENKTLPAVDILHLDMPALLDQNGEFEQQAHQGLKTLSEPLKQAAMGINLGKNTIYLQFEKDTGEKRLIPVDLVADLLSHYPIALVILSSGPSVKTEADIDSDIDSIALNLISKGLPFVLVIRDSLLATQKLFETFYDSLVQGQKIGTALDTARSALYSNTARRDIMHQSGPVKLHLHDWFLPALYQQGQDTALLTQMLPDKEKALVQEKRAFSHNLSHPPACGFFGRWQELRDIERRFMRGIRRINIHGGGGQGKTSLAQETGRWLQHTGMFKYVVYVDYGNCQILDPVSVAISMISEVLQKHLLDVDAVTQALRRVPTLLILDNVDLHSSAQVTPLPSLFTTSSKEEENTPPSLFTTASNGEDNTLPSLFTSSSNEEENTLPSLFTTSSKEPDTQPSLFTTASKEEESQPSLFTTTLKEEESQPSLFTPFSKEAENTPSILTTPSKEDEENNYFSSFFEQEVEDKKAGVEDKKAEVEDKKAEVADEEDEKDKRHQLLEAVKKWSEAGKSRVIIITRQGNLSHLDFPEQGNLKYYLLPLGKLEENQAVRYAEALMTQPPLPAYGVPKRAALTQLLEQAHYHPLSIHLLVHLLKNNHIETLTAQFNQSLAALSADTLYLERPLVAALNLSLEKLDPSIRNGITRLGIFQCGAFENILQGITQIPEPQWQTLRQTLEAGGLIQPDNLEGITVNYLKFHPSLAPLLWNRLSQLEQEALTERYCQGYHELSLFLYDEDNQKPHQTRLIERRELPNLLHAVEEALDSNKKDALEFADKVISFLVDFGFKTDSNKLTTRRTEKLSTSTAVSQEEYLALSQKAERLYSDSQYSEAQAVYQEILGQLGEDISYNRCLTLSGLGRCLAETGDLEQAADYFRQSLAELAHMQPSQDIKREAGLIQTYLATVLMEMEDYSGAKAAYNTALSIMKNIGNSLHQAAIQSQLGKIAMLQNQPQEAEHYYRDALNLFKQLKDQKSEALVWHQLGMVCQKAKRWKAADEAYQQAAKLYEKRGNQAETITIWQQLAQVNQENGHVQSAEIWYRKVIEGYKVQKEWKSVSKGFQNLAKLLQTQPHRLDEAWQLAEACLNFDKSLEPDQSEIWEIYSLLADIAEKRHDTPQAKHYRNLALQAKSKIAGRSTDLQQHQQFIDAMVQTIAQPKLRKQLDSMLQQRENKGWRKLTAASRRILEGERDWNKLYEQEALDMEDAMIVQEILQRLEKKNPERLILTSDNEPQTESFSFQQQNEQQPQLRF